MQNSMSSTATTCPSVSHSNLLAVYHVLWPQQDHSALKQGFDPNVADLEDEEQLHSFTFDAIDLSRHPGAKLPNGMISMIIPSLYETFHKVSMTERNLIVHGSAGIAVTSSPSNLENPAQSRFPTPVSQVASRLLADGITSADSSAAKETADNLLDSEDTTRYSIVRL
ncbi:hypothetical protein DFH29DRAFT_871624 [Suillus ampliporus]|nr:hypothetical protein DFH29DRAFT_871624 [Suillus ampliporus]